MTKIRKLRVTLEGKTYDMVVEILDDVDTAVPTPLPMYAPAASPHPVYSPVAASPATESPAATATAPGDVGAPVAGKVTAVHVKIGDLVQINDKLITMEAMKMFVDVCAPSPGAVTAINCAVGDVVNEGHPLVKLA